MEAEGLEFKWGKKKGVGGKKKDVQFYESFTYDGDEYHLYDSVLVGNASDPDSTEPFVGMIIKIWEHSNKRAKMPRQVKLLWFFKPSEISLYLEGVSDVLPNELFLASGEGPGLANVNQLEALGGKCSVLCISKDKRNPQPTDEEIKSADFVFRRAFDVKSCKVLDTIDDKIAGVDVKFIFNKAGKNEGTAVQKIEAAINGNSDSLKLNGVSARKREDTFIKPSSCKDVKENDHNQLATKKSTFVEKRSNKDSGVQEDTGRNEHDSCKASDSRANHCDAKAQESEVKKQLTKQKSVRAEERNGNSCEASGSKINHSNSKNARVSDGEKQLIKQKSMPREASHTKYSNGLDDRPQKKQKLDGSITVPDGKNTKTLPIISSDGKKDTETFKRPKDKVTGDGVPTEKPSFVKKKQDLGHSVSEGKDVIATEKSLSKKHSFDGKLLKHTKDKMLAVDIDRNYQVIEVSQRPDVNSTWYRRPLNLPFWEESMREAEKQERLVLLQNLDPTYTSDEVQDIVYSALNEQCTARMIECTSVTIPHIGQALVIFNSREAAERAIKRLDEGCLLLSNGWPLVAAFAKINPPGKPSSFTGHIKPPKTQTRRERETKDAVSTSHCSQPNTIEYEMAMDWCLHRARSDHAIETLSEQQLGEQKPLRINFKPKLR